MKQIQFHPAILTILITLIFLGNLFAPISPAVQALQLTATPAAGDGMYITVITEEPQINVRMGPNVSVYPIVGKLPTGSTASALGRSQGGDWIQIEYSGAPDNKGWVYSPLVQVSPGTLRVVAPPPTPLPPATSTFDPTLVAQFNIVPTNTRLPTFTPPPSLNVLSFTDATESSSRNSVPLATIIIALAILGSIGFLLSIFFRR
jgi:uncharacterized protein YgiM (DUF1202 family)